MKQKIKFMLLTTLVVVALTGCACNGQGTTPSPSPSAVTTTPLPTQSASQEPSPMTSPSTSPEGSQTPMESGTDQMAVDTESLKMEVEKLSEVDTVDVVAQGDKAIIGMTFDAQYQGTLTERIQEMVLEKITALKAGITNVAVTADPTLCTEVKTLAEETRGKSMTEEQKTKFDELYAKIKPAGTESSTAK